MPLRAIYKPEPLAKQWGRRFWPHLFALLTTGAALGLSLLIPEIGEKPFFILFFIATAACAWLYGMAASCTSVVFNALALIYFVLSPAKSFGVEGWDYLIRLLVFIGASLCVAWLISRFRSTQQALKLAQERFQLAHEIAHIWSWELDLATGKVIWSSNPKNTGLRHEDPVQVWLQLVHPEDRDRVLAALKQAVDTAHPYAIEFRVHGTDDGVRWIASSGEFYKSAKGEQRMIGVNVDITLRKQAEKALETSAKQELAAQLAHEINNPLQGLMHALYLLHQQVAKSDANEYSVMAQAEAQRVSQLVNRLLQLYPASRQT